MSPHDCGQRNSIKPPSKRELDLRDLARSITSGKSVRTRCIISRCRATMRGIKLEIGESSYRKSVNRLAAVRSEKAGAETAIPALELFRLFLLLRNRFCSPRMHMCTTLRTLCTHARMHAGRHVGTYAHVTSCSLGR